MNHTKEFHTCPSCEKTLRDEKTVPEKTKIKTCSGYRVVMSKDEKTITILPEVEGAVLQLNQDRASSLAATIQTSFMPRDIREQDCESQQKEFRETLRHYGISDEEIFGKEFNYFKTGIKLFKLAYGIPGLEDLCGWKKFRAIIDYDADWDNYIIRFLPYDTREDNLE